MLKTGYYDLAVLELYRAVEAALKKLLISRQVYVDIRRPIDLLAAARRHHVISEDTAGSVNYLRRLRNDAVHSREQIVRETAEEALGRTKSILSAIEEENEPIGGPEGRDG